ncbi:hypothetical protein P879_04531 [Paragonimus westermani]|uniref:FHA domain-containing protein n=1 Tax=Paragonimus westermani TaxID=34504 RepID=A0A8T0DA65_9TREM|nr:hypothetical protein P879_04531 [Paragonimus westermani]
MSAFLQALGWVYPLSPKLTTIGQSGCDIIIDVSEHKVLISVQQNPSVDEQHAVIERSEKDNSMTIRDLNSKKGTYVNNVLIEKSSVLLKPRDKLRFGCSPTVYEFEMMSPTDKHSLNRKYPLDTNAHQSTESGRHQEKVTSNNSELDTKDQLISRLQNDLNRLSPLEAISAQKDILIRRLQQQVTQLSAGKIPRSFPLTQESPSSQTGQECEHLEIPFVKAHDNSKYLQQTEAHEKEMTGIRQKYKATEIRCDTLNSELDRTKLEVEKLKQALDEKQSFEEKWHKEMEELKSTVTSLERSERNAKLDKQETVSQVSFFHLLLSVSSCFFL